MGHFGHSIVRLPPTLAFCLVCASRPSAQEPTAAPPALLAPSSQRSPERAREPQPPPPRNPLLAECAYCEEDHREWYRDTAQLRHMAELCRYDYLMVRLDRTYDAGGASISAAYFLSVFADRVRFVDILLFSGNTGQWVGAATVVAG